MSGTVEEKDLVLEEVQLSGAVDVPATAVGEIELKKKKKRVRHRRKARNAAVFNTNNSMGEPSGGSIAAGTSGQSIDQNIDVLEKLDAYIINNKAACKLLLTQNQVQGRDSSKEENSKKTSVASDDSGIKVLYKCNTLMDNAINLGDSSMSVNKCGIENESDFKQTLKKDQEAVHEVMLFDQEDFNKVPNPSIQSVDVNGNRMKINIKEMNERIPQFTPLDLKKKLQNIQNATAALGTSKGLQKDPRANDNCRKENVKNKVITAAAADSTSSGGVGETFVKISAKNAASFCGTGTGIEHLRTQEQKMTHLKTTSASAHNCSNLGKLEEDKLPSFVQIHMDQNTNYLVEHYQSSEVEEPASILPEKPRRIRKNRNAADFLKFLGDLELGKASYSGETGSNYSSKYFSIKKHNGQGQGLQISQDESEYQNGSSTTKAKEGEFVEVELEPNYFSTTGLGTSCQRFVSAVVEDPNDDNNGQVITNSQSKIKSKASKEHSGAEKKSASGFKRFFSCFSNKKKDKDSKK